jgi:hypothetical protein
MATPRYVVHAPPYSTTSGGVLVMHQLARILHEMGEQVVIFPMQIFPGQGLRLQVRFRLFPPPYEREPGSPVPVSRAWFARRGDVVIYPEIAQRNALRARNVAWWLLNRPSLFNIEVKAGPRDLFFTYDPRCDEPKLTKGTARPLFLFKMNPMYRQTNFGPRKGSCYLIRKGSGKPMVHDLDGSVLIDDMSHEAVVRVFNECETFYCYDELSSYAQFAAVCGCTSIVVPGLFADRAEYVANYPLGRYGVAYGEADVAHALATKDRVAEYLLQCEANGIDSVRAFVERTKQHFFGLKH